MVSQLSPTCGFLDVVSQLFPTLLHLLSSLPPGLPDVVSQLSPTCGFLDVVSQSGGFELFSRSFADVVSQLSPRCGS